MVTRYHHVGKLVRAEGFYHPERVLPRGQRSSTLSRRKPIHIGRTGIREPGGDFTRDVPDALSVAALDHDNQVGTRAGDDILRQP
jgi:hypothetical protein